ncbi:hypothetical protein CFIO01_04108 [Colletotrichum fioriniae PJ7]|uniref:Uncharacterized protein n=1 Tax=Colletotrichum fioriniae PJ7 TaxID=1445577 RepID=A0A010RJ49_9PEZI|nr:hypothetical protein CFIO01_04108 [Colletotrichum fioriniae PJ7]
MQIFTLLTCLAAAFSVQARHHNGAVAAHELLDRAEPYERTAHRQHGLMPRQTGPLDPTVTPPPSFNSTGPSTFSTHFFTNTTTTYRNTTSSRSSSTSSSSKSSSKRSSSSSKSSSRSSTSSSSSTASSSSSSSSRGSSSSSSQASSSQSSSTLSSSLSSSRSSRALTSSTLTSGTSFSSTAVSTSSETTSAETSSNSVSSTGSKPTESSARSTWSRRESTQTSVSSETFSLTISSGVSWSTSYTTATYTTVDANGNPYVPVAPIAIPVVGGVPVVPPVGGGGGGGGGAGAESTTTTTSSSPSSSSSPPTPTSSVPASTSWSSVAPIASAVESSSGSSIVEVVTATSPETTIEVVETVTSASPASTSAAPSPVPCYYFANLGGLGRADLIEVDPATNAAYTHLNECKGSGGDDGAISDPGLPSYSTNDPLILWDYAPVYAQDSKQPYPPLKNDDGSDIAVENLRETRLFGFRQCDSGTFSNIKNGWRDFNRLSLMDRLSSNIDWNSQGINEFFGQGDQKKLSDDKKKQIQNIFYYTSQMWTHCLGGGSGDPEDHCGDKENPSEGGPAALITWKWDENRYTRALVCRKYTTLGKDLDDLTRYMNTERTAGDRLNLTNWEHARGGYWLHEATHMDYFMNTPSSGSEPVVRDLLVDYRDGRGENKACGINKAKKLAN